MRLQKKKDLESKKKKKKWEDCKNGKAKAGIEPLSNKLENDSA